MCNAKATDRKATNRMSPTDVNANQLLEITRVKTDYILIDCRSFLVFNKGHISGALNIRCNSIMKRRNKGMLTLENAITNGDTRNDFLSGRFSTIIVYDDQGGNLLSNENEQHKTKRTLSMVIEVLQRHAPLTTLITYLNCGFKEFSRLFPEKCTGFSGVVAPSELSIQTAAVPTSIKTPIYDQGAPVEILPHLYLGSAHHASQKSQLQSLGITSVLNASSTCPNYFEDDFTYKRIPVEDNNKTDIGSWFSEAISFINDVKSSNEKVLVHCYAGISRSATICLAYLISCHKVTLSEAFHYVKCRRNVISPNFNFMGQLLKFENDLAARDNRRPTTNFNSCFNANPLEIEVKTKDNLFKVKRPSSQTLHLSIPLTTQNENSGGSCLTAPARMKEFSFFMEPQRSCSQESASIDNRSINPIVTLST